MIQVIGYVRRSTDKQDESLDQQRGKLEAFVTSKGWTLAHVYADDAISGSDMDRPGLAEFMKRAESDASIGAVIAWDRNRLARPKDPMDYGGGSRQRSEDERAGFNRRSCRRLLLPRAPAGFSQRHLTRQELRQSRSADTARQT